jgi:hypothetical protein
MAHAPLSHVASWLTQSASADASESESPATPEQLAAIEFEPIDPEIKAAFVGSRWKKECASLGAALCLSCMVVEKTKPEVIGGTAALLNDEDGGTEAFEEGLDFLKEWKDLLTAYADLLQAAYIRQLIGAAVVSGFGEPDERP